LFRLSLNLADSVDEFSACVERNLVVSEVFCLPADYKKDIPPPSESRSHRISFRTWRFAAVAERSL
jgi:hypothetical protein